MDSTNTPKPYTRKRKIDQISADATEIATPLLNNNASDENKSSDVSATALSIREKLKSGRLLKIIIFINFLQNLKRRTKALLIPVNEATIGTLKL
jgi:hypothetical protein